MKKICSFIVALMVVAGVSAQTFQMNPASKMKAKAGKSVVKAPALAEEGDITWGYYSGPSSQWSGLGVGSSASFGVGIFVPGDDFGGANLKAVRIPVLVPDMTSVSVWAKESLSGKNLCSKRVDDGSFQAGSYLEVAFDEPYTIPAAGLYVGYSFTSDEAYPIAIAGEPAPNGLLLEVNGGGFADYYDYGFGVSPLQIVVSGLQLKDYNAEITSLQAITTLASSEFTTYAMVSNTSKNPINSIDYTIDVDGVKEQKHLDLPEAIPAGLAQTGVVEIKGTSPAEVKPYNVTVTIDKVNGQPNEKEGSISATFVNVTKAVARRTVVEEFTGTGCGWCPRGWVGMERTKATFPDTFVGIAFHKFNSSDPMYVVNYFPTQSLGISGAPGCSINRLMSVDPYSGTGYGLWNDVAAINEELPVVDVTVDANWIEDQKAVSINTQIEPLTSGLGFTVAYVLTADSLSGTTAAWKQQNYYASNYTAAELGDDEELAQFGRGGKLGQSAVFLVFNDVMIGSSYSSSGKNMAPTIKGANNAQLGEIYQGNCEMNFTTKTTLVNAINKDLVFANVLVISNATGEILNAARCALKAEPEPDAIQTIENTDSHKADAIYNLAGQRVEKAQHGIYIVGGKKIMVK